jgi:pyruvate/2-oxoglutarate dehydrogenase complex dihydrolipoamide dehydrogenase (E3) component
LTLEHFDAVVIGAGQSGGPLASALARGGLQTALIEREYAGGTCVNTGCTPTKTMIASARVAHVVNRGVDYGVDAGAVAVDMRAVRRRKRDTVETFRKGSLNAILSTEGLEYIEGEARFTDEKTLEITLTGNGTRRLTADKILINTGTRPAVPDIPGLDLERCYNSTTIMELDHVPEHLIVVGGGYVGLEFAQMFRRFGSEATVVQRGSQLLRMEDGDIAEEIQQILEEDGVVVHLNASVVSVEQTVDGLTVGMEKKSGETVPVHGSHLLMAAGRQPNTDTLDPEKSGIQVDERGFIPVNDCLETNVDGIWAMGDVNGGPAFTHISYNDYRVLKANLLESGSLSNRDRQLPYVVFTDPELGRIGLTERQAREQGFDIKIAKMPMGNVARAIEMDETRGVMKAVIDAGSDQILGAAVLGINGGELMAILQVAMTGKLPYTVLRDSIFAHPTLAESLNNLFANVE